MAEVKSFPNNQDVYVGAEWVMKWLHGRTSGVFGAENNLATSVVPNSMSVEISDGTGWLSNANGDGIVFWNDNEQTNGNKLKLTHDVADGSLDRIDRIVVTWETTNYVSLPTISILKGTPSSSPSAPALTNNSTQRQISLARIRIPAGTVSLSASMVTDERLDASVCGIVTEYINIDTSTMHEQFSDLLSDIEEQLQNINAGTEVLLKSGGVPTPKNPDQAANKEYVDNSVIKKDFAIACGSSSGLTLRQDEITKINLDTWKIIGSEEFDFSDDGGIVMPKSGNVRIIASVYFNFATPSAPASFGPYVKKNDVEVAGLLLYSQYTTAVQVQTIVPVEMGDILTLNARSRTRDGSCIPRANTTTLTVIYL